MTELDFVLTGTRHHLQLSQVKLSYLEWASPGKPLLLLHGLADHSLVWASFAQALGPDYHCVAPDLRGHGDSEKPLQGYRCTDIIEDLEELLAQLNRTSINRTNNWTKVTVVAHSWGAKVAALWATQSPERFDRLVLVDPFSLIACPVG